jgi:hypothetical protein
MYFISGLYRSLILNRHPEVESSEHTCSEHAFSKIEIVLYFEHLEDMKSFLIFVASMATAAMAAPFQDIIANGPARCVSANLHQITFMHGRAKVTSFNRRLVL